MENALVLDSNWEVLGDVSWRRALTLVVSGKAEVLNEYPDTVRTVRMEFRVPAVIRLLVRVAGKRVKPPALCRPNILKRDGYGCQYCGRRFTVAAAAEGLTVDHVVPKSRGGPFSWENVAAACKPCNNRKADRKPHEAGMRLLRAPRAPMTQMHVTVTFGNRDYWRDFLPYVNVDEVVVPRR